MTGQEIAAFVVVGLAVAYLAARRLRKKASGNCCGEKECPAARGMLDKIQTNSKR